MDADDLKADLHGYLQNSRDALTWKLSGLSEYDVQRPLTPTGTNLLGLATHLDARNLPSEDGTWWAAHRDRVERAARDAEQASGRFA